MGYAKLVLEKIIQEAKDQNISAIDLMATTDGITLYKKLGFVNSIYQSMRLKL